MYGIGDAAETGAMKTGNAGWYQAETASRNILKTIEGDEEPLESYVQGPAIIKITVGLVSIYLWSFQERIENGIDVHFFSKDAQGFPIDRFQWSTLRECGRRRSHGSICRADVAFIRSGRCSGIEQIKIQRTQLHGCSRIGVHVHVYK